MVAISNRQYIFDPFKKTFGHLTIAFRSKMKKVDKFLVLAIQMRVSIDQSHVRILPGKLFDKQ